MAGQIVLIVDGLVVRDDGNVMGSIHDQLRTFLEPLDRLEQRVDERYAAEKAELAALREDIMTLTTGIEGVLAMPQDPVITQDNLDVLDAQVRGVQQRATEVRSKVDVLNNPESL